MKIVLTADEAVRQLHENGFTNDFQLFGNSLLWLQENIFIKEEEFFISEYHQITEPKTMVELVVFGVIVPSYNIKGILVNHYRSYTKTTPSVIVSKLEELTSNIDENYIDY
jgi:hypothetical protein